MTKQPDSYLSRREQQIMDAIYKLGEASVSDVQKQLPDPPGYSAVRTLMNILKDKGYLIYRQEKSKYIYMPTVQADVAKRSALTHLVDTFFDGSMPNAVSTLLDISADSLSESELEDLAKMIEAARKEKQG